MDLLSAAVPRYDDVVAARLEGVERRRLTGWGRTAPSSADVFRPLVGGEASRALAVAGPRGALARGLGRSYGDAAQNAGGLVVDTTGLTGVHAVDLEAGTITVDAGVSLDTLLRLLVRRGWMPAVLPGTRYVTVGGAIAADVHGKNHHVDGAFTRHVHDIELATPTGIRTLRPDDDAFAATAGGMGLTGVVTRATLRLRAIATASIRVDTERFDDLDDLMTRMVATDDHTTYSVAWLDGAAGGRRLGRGVLTRGEHAAVDELPVTQRATARAYDPRQLVTTPAAIPRGLLNRATVRAFNEAWFRRAPRHREGEIQPLSAFFHPLDAVGWWNRLHGPRGFVQYQWVVPETAGDLIATTLQLLRAAAATPTLIVLKRFGAADGGHLSFPMPGWTLAIDVPVASPALGRALDRCDELVAAAGGRVYLAKDARMRPELVPTMYPRLAAWRAVRDRLDPDGVLTSDLDRRLDLTGLHHANGAARA